MADDPPPASLKDDGASDEGPQEEEAKAPPREEKKNGLNGKKKKEVIMSAYGDPIEDVRKCTYSDFSHVTLTENPMGDIKRNPANKEATFPMKLHVIVSSPEFWEVEWLPHGRSWRINNPKSFEERVIPIFFRHGRYTSFARQVNGWGFRRITHGSDFNSYYHELFLRGMPHLCQRMKRLTNKDAGVRKRAEAEKTPDFVAISREHPLPEEGPMLPPSAVALSVPSVAPPPARNMDNYLNRLSEHGGVDAYIQSLSDAEISFLARRQMFRSEGGGHGVPPQAHGGHSQGGSAIFPGMMGSLGGSAMGGMPMGPNPGMPMRGMSSGDPRMPGPLSNPSMAGGNDDPRMSMPSRAGAAAGMGDSRGSFTPPRVQQGASPNPNVASRPHLVNPPQQGNAIDQFLNRASDSELAQLIAMHDVAGRRQQQQQQQQQPQQFRGFDS